MNRRHLLVTALGLGLTTNAVGSPVRLPALSAADHAWLNTAPLGAAELEGHPVLVEFWTHGCSNCLNTLPWMKLVYERYAPRGLRVIAAHTPEFPSERGPAAIRAAVERLGIRYPVLLDPDGAYWRALDNRYWPAFYLFDAAHALSATRIGELHAGEASADEFERAIQRLVSA